MDRWLNKLLFATALLLGNYALRAQSTVEITPEYKDYKSDDQFNKFHKRTKLISAWQINELREGSLIVRLRTNRTLIDALQARGDKETAKMKEAETFVNNKIMMKAFLDNFTFCKVFFMYSNSSDTLLKGARSGIFLDTNLQVDPAITLPDKYYLIGERDYVFNSSIGFVKEDSARFARETGNPVREMGVVLKNKYGHQLKNPFPYYVKNKTFADFGIPGLAQPILDGRAYLWVSEDDPSGVKKLKEQYAEKGSFQLKVKKANSYKVQSIIVQQLQESLDEYYKSTPKPDPNKMTPLVKPYLY